VDSYVRRQSIVYYKIAARSFSKGRTRRTLTLRVGRAFIETRPTSDTSCRSLGTASTVPNLTMKRLCTCQTSRRDILPREPGPLRAHPVKGTSHTIRSAFRRVHSPNLSIQTSKMPCVLGQNTWIFNDTLSLPLHPSPRQRELGFPSS